MNKAKFKQFIFAFLKRFALLIVFYFIALWVSNNDIYGGFANYSWILLLGALIISIFTVYLKPNSKQK
ncbi:hypothetical protein [Carnobacterium sp.]|uniref:hypothetical protein n=1 Tax=Carnobacterium sp. TaxID=48221 RepID=UPI0028ADCDB3|nr:hypothetical protein [Carnobacterium sp.]